MSAFNTVDWVILALTLVIGLSAGFTGFFTEISSKLGLIAGIWSALVLTSSISPAIMNLTGLSPLLSSLVSYSAVMLTVWLLVRLIGRWLENTFETAHLGFVDHLLGFVLGLLEALILFSFLWSLLNTLKIVKLSAGFSNSWFINNIIESFGSKALDFAGRIKG